MKTKPNVLWIIVDCLRADRCQSVNNPLSLMAWPRLRDSGVCFEQAISSASITPVSFASMLTSLYHFSHGVYSLQGPSLNIKAKTITEIFSENGYFTKAILTGPLGRPFGLDRGFMDYDCRDRRETVYTDWWEEFKTTMDGLYKMENPWFAVAHFFELHRPIQAADRKGLTKENYQLYDLAWQQLDAKIAELLKNVPEDTIIVFTADHGERLTRRSDSSPFDYMLRKVRKICGYPKRPQDWIEHGFFPYDELHRVPLSISGPGVPSGKVISEQVRHIDIMPTILELCGLPCPENIHGSSLMPVIQGLKAKEQLPAYIYTGWADSLRYWHGVRTSEGKYIEPAGYLALPPTVYYYDLESDPGELKNLNDTRNRVALNSCEYRLRLMEILNDNPMKQQALADSSSSQFSQEQRDSLKEKLQDLGYM